MYHQPTYTNDFIFYHVFIESNQLQFAPYHLADSISFLAALLSCLKVLQCLRIVTILLIRTLH